MLNQITKKKLEAKKVSLCHDLWAILTFFIVMVVISLYLYLTGSCSGKSILIVNFVILFIFSCGQENEGDTCDANP
jgi:hypothetical protein